MKSFTRACLMFSGIVIAIGLVLTIIGGLLGAGSTFFNMVNNGDFSFSWGNHHNSWSNEPLTSMNQEFSDIDQLDIDMKYGELIIQQSDGDSYKVEADNVVDGFTCEDKDGKLVIDDNIKDGINIGLVNDYHATITLSIPENANLDKVKIDMGAGSVKLSDINTKELKIGVGAGQLEGNKISAEESNFSVGAGQFVIEDLYTKTIDMECGTGKLGISGAIDGDATINCGIGNVVLSVSNSEKEYNYDVNCGIGNVILGDSSIGGIAQEKKIDNNADKTMDIECGVGSIEVNFDESI